MLIPTNTAQLHHRADRQPELVGAFECEAEMNQLQITAIHEAGHAYAVGLRGGTVTGLTIKPGLTTFTLPGRRTNVIHRNDAHQIIGIERAPYLPAESFVSYAGPWAEAKALHVFESRAEDRRAQPFSAYLDAATRRNKSDAKLYADSPELDAYSAELEQHWNDILRLADRILNQHRARVAR